jgi:hypothetical protein
MLSIYLCVSLEEENWKVLADAFYVKKFSLSMSAIALFFWQERSTGINRKCVLLNS